MSSFSGTSLLKRGLVPTSPLRLGTPAWPFACRALQSARKAGRGGAAPCLPGLPPSFPKWSGSWRCRIPPPAFGDPRAQRQHSPRPLRPSTAGESARRYCGGDWLKDSRPRWPRPVPGHPLNLHLPSDQRCPLSFWAACGQGQREAEGQEDVCVCTRS